MALPHEGASALVIVTFHDAAALAQICCVLQEEELAAWETEKEAEMQRLKRHQRVLDKQSRVLLKLPNRKERSEVGYR